MIKYVTGNLLESGAEALVNTVNTVGVMGKGIALQFKKAFPNNFKKYAEVCKNNELEIGQLLVTEEGSLFEKKYIINFPTKTHWKKPSEYDYIKKGLNQLVRLIEERGIKSIAIPPLGAGNGGLDWEKVKEILEQYLTNVNAEILIYQPNSRIKEALNKERAKLTPARAMLLAVLYDLVKNGEFVSEFAAEKTAYFLQRFGGEKEFKLSYKQHFYGPYSGKVRHVLYYLNGSYITGYSTKDKKPFDAIGIIPDGEDVVNQFLLKPDNQQYKQTVDKTKQFLSGFYSSFGLELLSSIDFLMQELKTDHEEEIVKELERWSSRKRTLFSNKSFITKAINHLKKHLDHN